MKTTQRGFIIPLLLIIVAILLAGGGAYFYTQTKSENPPVTENVALPQATSTAQTSDWKTFTNTKYGYNLRYPKTLRGPVSNCGGEGIDVVAPAEICNEVGINTEPVINPNGNPGFDDSIIIRVLNNSGVVPIETFVNKVLSRATLSEPVGVKKIDSINSYTATFSGGLSSYPDGQSGESYGGRTAVLFVPIDNNQILRVTYPVEFCFILKKSDQLNQLRFTSPCYSDDRNKLYEQIISTFKFNP